MPALLILAGGGFPICGPAHLVALVMVVGIGVGLGLGVRRVGNAGHGLLLRRVVCFVLAAWLLAAWLAENVLLALQRYGSLDESLPLHLCDLALLACVVALINLGRPVPVTNPPSPAQRTHQVLCELAYFWGLAGTTQALLTPDLEEGFPSFACVRYFVTHGGIIVTVLLMTIGLRWRPLPGAVWRTWLITGLVAASVGLVNWVLGTNYMYLCGPPGNPSLYDYLGPWPWTILSMAVLGAVLFGVCYLPFRVSAARRGERPFRGPA